MTPSMLRGVRLGLGLLAAGTILGTGGAIAAPAPSGAPSPYPVGALVQALPAPDSGAELRRHLATLASNPRDVSALIGAGRAAIAVGDGQAAMGFFGRAQEIAPRDARVAAGMGSAFVLLEQPQAALRFFGEAVAFGAPEVEIARDRGLAFDMTGNPRRAQQDYVLVLQRGEDAEVRRRLALSLAISGHRAAALGTLDPLLRANDRAAYRTRAFVLALTGDAAGATQAVDGAMPGQGQAMAPFLGRLAALNPAQKALAVHFGRFPADGRPAQMTAALDTSALPAAVAMSGAAPAPSFAGRVAQPVPGQQAGGLRRRTTLAEPVSSRERRRPGTQPELDYSDRVGPGARGGGQSRTAAAPVRSADRGQAPAPAQTVRSQPAPAQPGFSSAPPQPQPAQYASAPPLDIPPAMRQDSAVPITAAPSPSPPRPAPPRPAPPAPAPVQRTAPSAPQAAAQRPAVEAPPPDFSAVAALVEALPTEEPVARPAPAPAPAPARSTAAAARTPPRTGSSAAPAARRTTTAARSAAPAPARARPAAPPANPSRHWVQLAGGERAGLNYELGRVRRAAPELLQGRTAWWARNGNSHRLLVGPFASEAEARALVNQLLRRQVPSFAWRSAAGEEVARLPAR
jgi:Flp pilus assembly protein TadD